MGGSDEKKAKNVRTVRMIEIICYNCHCTSVGVESVDLVLEARGRTEILDPAIDCVGEVNLFVLRMDRYIVERVELAAKVVVENDY